MPLPSLASAHDLLSSLPFERDSRGVDRKLAAAYWHLLSFLRDVGILGSNNIFYPAVGMDLVPADFCLHLWTTDRRLNTEAVLAGYGYVVEDVMTGAGVRPSRPVRNLTHRDKDITNISELRSWLRHLTPGDVILLKHAKEYILAQSHPNGCLEFLASLLGIVPQGVYVVLFEPGVPFENDPLPNGLREFFEDHGFREILSSLLKEDDHVILSEINSLLRTLARQNRGAGRYEVWVGKLYHAFVEMNPGALTVMCKE